MRSHERMGFRPTVLAVALAAAFAPVLVTPVFAEEKAPEDKSVEASVEAGFGAATGSRDDRALFGQYNSLSNGNAFGLLLGFDYSLRRPETNTWVDAFGRDLGGPLREAGVVWKQPGEWKVGASYSEGVRRDPFVSVPPGTGNETQFQTKRTALGLNLSKSISRDLQLEIDFRHENKEGSRLFGRGFTCPSTVAPGCGPTTGIAVGWAVLMQPEPIDSTLSQVDARLSYANGPLRLSAGYYGSFYRNSLSVLATAAPGSALNAVGTPLPLVPGLAAILAQPIALPPDNQAHQLDVTGTWDFGHANTRANFRFAYGVATQHDSFAGAGFTGAPAGVASLDGKVTTTLAKIGLTSRPVAKLSLQADVRYESRDDKTPIALYNIEGTATYTNRQLPYRKTSGKLQGSWQFSPEWRATAGADYETIDRGTFTPTSAANGITALRQDTHEAGVFAEVRRRMTESVSGAVKLSTSRRGGSNWLRDNSGVGVTEVDVSALPAGSILMPTLADRRRDKVKVFADWQASDAVALQVAVEAGRDHYDQLAGYGLGSTGMDSVSVDGSYAINDNWNTNAFVTWGRQTLNQAKPLGYVMALRDASITAGVGVAGKLTSQWEVGGSVALVDDRTAYRQTLDPLAGADSATLLAAIGGLPDIAFRQAALKLFANYKVDAKSSVRVDFIYQQSHWNDWAWGYNGVPFTYSDGTTVAQKPSQNVAFVGVVYRYRFK
ncbi:MAG TPA: MtrB/PioB family decaheme-associated outer membrane protein [Ramlibacter sp.]|uniref:MtrB/PioB family decaheme-associated outer membrane protein n=1 Tax=Ramlibacter sp. TaxID=1917967 RepID=UPI002C8F9A7F|nr:MtrB/PioB family decaheme-associated outer membrane protein [Ramlibacter sp.]HVZ43697.1 MtrB/PioB family decaheme-associated outer membrane protein [Ramlibacter sp.]